MKKNNMLKIITSILTVFNLGVTIYYLKNSYKSSSKLRKMQNKLNSIKNDLENITDELEELTDELNKNVKSKDKRKVVEEDINADDIAEIDDITEETSEEEE